MGRGWGRSMHASRFAALRASRPRAPLHSLPHSPSPTKSQALKDGRATSYFSMLVCAQHITCEARSPSGRVADVMASRQTSVGYSICAHASFHASSSLRPRHATRCADRFRRPTLVLSRDAFGRSPRRPCALRLRTALYPTVRMRRDAHQHAYRATIAHASLPRRPRRAIYHEP